MPITLKTVIKQQKVFFFIFKFCIFHRIYSCMQTDGVLGYTIIIKKLTDGKFNYLENNKN